VVDDDIDRFLGKKVLPREAQVVDKGSEPGRIAVRRQAAEGIRIPAPQQSIVRWPRDLAGRAQMIGVYT
jgi:hypothetical protein